MAKNVIERIRVLTKIDRRKKYLQWKQGMNVVSEPHSNLIWEVDSKDVLRRKERWFLGMIRRKRAGTDCRQRVSRWAARLVVMSRLL